MKAIVVEDIGKIAIKDVPEPVPTEYQAKVKVVAGSICNSTDKKILHAEFAGPFPTVLGHESVGTIVEVGSKVRSYKVGELVVRPHVMGIPDYPLSASFGSFVEYGLVTDAWAQAEDEGQERPVLHDQISSPGDSDPQTLVQAITLKETLSFLHDMGVGAGQSLLIFGTGPVGLSFSLWARYLGCEQVIVVGRRDAACQKAMDFGRATHVINNKKQNVPETVKGIVPGGVTFAIEAIGENAVLRDCLDSLSESGQVGIYGVPPASQGRSPLMDDPKISPAEPGEALAHAETMEQIANGTIPAREFLTHELDYTECAKGFELLDKKEAFKVGLNFGG